MANTVAFLVVAAAVVTVVAMICYFADELTTHTGDGDDDAGA